jgi:hypothetical protein
MYRESATIDPKERPPSELVVALKGQDRRSSAVILFQLFTIPMLVAALLSATVTPAAGLVGLVVTGSFFLWRWRKRAQTGTIVMTVEAGELVVQAGRRALARIRLGDLEDVALDTKAIRPVQEGGSAIPAVRFIDSKVGPEIDVARIVLVGEGRSVRLHEDHVAHMTATEWLGKIRVFLRKNGWVPVDETGPKSAE